MACDLTEIQADACSSGIGRLRDKIALLQIIAQLTCEASENGGSSVPTYKATLNQSGTNAPVATVLENTLGGTPVLAYVQVGVYTMTLNGAFPADKTFVLTGSANEAFGGVGSGSFYAWNVFRQDANTILIRTLEAASGGEVNGALIEAGIQIQVFP